MMILPKVTGGKPSPRQCGVHAVGWGHSGAARDRTERYLIRSKETGNSLRLLREPPSLLRRLLARYE